MKKKSVCFISFEAYHGFINSIIPIAGGAEFQQILLAKKLYQKGCEVSFIVGDFGQNSTEVIEGIKVYKAFNPNRRNHGLNFFKNMYSLYQAMKHADADIYNFRSDSFYVGLICIFCKLLKKRFIFSTGTDRNASLSILKNLKWPMPYLYILGIKWADIIISQTEMQKKQLLSNFSVNSLLVRNCVQVENKSSKKKRSYFLWVGKVFSGKRPDLYLKIASNFPDEEFLIIGGPGNDEVYNDTKRKTQELPNVRFIGFVPQREIYRYYEAAKALICTSESEGFPNTFLQAWIHQVPVISLSIDPDECICDHKLGFHSQSFEQLIKDIENLSQNEKIAKEMGKNGKEYVMKYHDVEVITNKYIKIFNQLI